MNADSLTMRSYRFHFPTTFLAFASIALRLAPLAAAPTVAEAYGRGVQLEKEGDYVHALEMFDSIPASKQTPLTRLHRATCKAKLMRLLDAEADLEALRTDPSVDAAMVETAASDLDDLRPRIPILTVTQSRPLIGVVVTVDGVVVVPPVSRKVDPGVHTIIARRHEVAFFQRKVTLAESTSIDVEIDAPGNSAPEEKLGPPNGQVVSPSPAPTHWASPPAWAVVSLSTAALAIGFGTYMSITATSKNEESNARGRCVDNRCTSEGAALRNSALVRADAATVFFLTGGVLAAGGVVLWVAAKTSDRGSTHVSVSPSGFMLRGSF